MALVVANAAFVATEFALVAVDRTRVDERASRGDRRALRVRRLVRQLSFHLSGAQVGITVTSLMLGFLAEPTVAEVIAPVLEAVFGSATPRGASIGVALGLATVVQMVLGELVPKTVATTRPYGTAVAVSLPAIVYGVLVRPFVAFMNGVANLIVRRLGVEPREDIDPIVDRDELEHLFVSSGTEGELDEGEVRLLTKTIRLGHKSADDAMVPRVEVVAIDRNATISELIELAVRSGHSRFPVMGDSLDDVVGVIHVKSVYRVPAQQRSTTPVGEMMADVLAVPESRDLNDLLLDLRGERRKSVGGVGAGQLAVVIDEHGGTAGIITLEDVLEEIVGEIDDEHDAVQAERTRTESRGSTVIPASLHPDEVFEATGFEMPDGAYETLAGLLLDQLGHIPEPGEVATVKGWRLEVVAMNRLRIATVRVTEPEPLSQEYL